ncbi:hypothetical protein [Rhizobium leguminosarum]|uniref:hypothetical protein n=1 Tax=Rhizobium leguminosarum TaxID=384 RepID=UPI00143F9C67|nr:hypothetical protein [Rhizobium leguminosarum]NKL23682.1 hypothetical protein [Rhizobium leguminosarum bv. viciae]
MSYFTIGLEMAATIYILAGSLSEAQGKLNEVLSKSIDALDPDWFSDAWFGMPGFPEISFATAMEVWGAGPQDTCKAISAFEVERLMRSFPDASKANVLARSSAPVQSERASVYWSDLKVKTNGILKFSSETEAKKFIALLPEERPHVHWEMANDWFELEGFDDAEYPMILSPNIEVVAVSEFSPLRLHWSHGHR